jgi:hypothetical protein
MRIQNQHFFADILHDPRGTPPVYHYIVQRQGSNQILYWSQENTEEEAIHAAERELTRLAGEHQAAV